MLTNARTLIICCIWSICQMKEMAGCSIQKGPHTRIALLTVFIFTSILCLSFAEKKEYSYERTIVLNTLFIKILLSTTIAKSCDLTTSTASCKGRL